jgi:hypothetical protein
MIEGVPPPLVETTIQPGPNPRITAKDGKPIPPGSVLPERFTIGELDPDGTATLRIDLTIDSQGRIPATTLDYHLDGRPLRASTVLDRPVPVHREAVKLSLAPGSHRFTVNARNEFGASSTRLHEIYVGKVPGTPGKVEDAGHQAEPPEGSTLLLTPDAAGLRPLAAARITPIPPRPSSPGLAGGGGDWATAMSKNSLGASLARQGRYSEAEPLLRESLAALQSSPAIPQGRFRQALERVVALYDAWGKPDQAAAWRLKLRDLDFPTDPFVP